jgi:hypothetical protein
VHSVSSLETNAQGPKSSIWVAGPILIRPGADDNWRAPEAVLGPKRVPSRSGHDASSSSRSGVWSRIWLVISLLKKCDQDQIPVQRKCRVPCPVPLKFRHKYLKLLKLEAGTSERHRSCPVKFRVPSHRWCPVPGLSPKSRGPKSKVRMAVPRISDRTFDLGHRTARPWLASGKTARVPAHRWCPVPSLSCTRRERLTIEPTKSAADRRSRVSTDSETTLKFPLPVEVFNEAVLWRRVRQEGSQPVKKAAADKPTVFRNSMLPRLRFGLVGSLHQPDA